mmetsp:Transcript_124952/g.361429  ORF Transcript_124952/g.361429 Transcript_124952/m.361429 type:complete len:289 (-) Transcript_124952:2312-3178(-)
MRSATSRSGRGVKGANNLSHKSFENNTRPLEKSATMQWRSVCNRAWKSAPMSNFPWCFDASRSTVLMAPGELTKLLCTLCPEPAAMRFIFLCSYANLRSSMEGCRGASMDTCPCAPKLTGCCSPTQGITPSGTCCGATAAGPAPTQLAAGGAGAACRGSGGACPLAPPQPCCKASHAEYATCMSSWCAATPFGPGPPGTSMPGGGELWLMWGGSIGGALLPPPTAPRARSSWTPPACGEPTRTGELPWNGELPCGDNTPPRSTGKLMRLGICEDGDNGCCCCCCCCCC